jgi:hypothetical protein
VKSAHAKTVLKYSNRKTGVLTGETLTPKIWDDLLLTTLHSVATGAAFENTYGGSAVFKEETTAEETTEDSEATTAETPATQEPKAEETKAE